MKALLVVRIVEQRVLDQNHPLFLGEQEVAKAKTMMKKIAALRK